jgi:hypothetical protein
VTELKYLYWSNKPKELRTLIFEVNVEGILEADKIFEEETGFNPIKNSWIGCQIKEEDDGS